MSATMSDGFGERWVSSMLDAVLNRTTLLADLDRRTGDGDFGTNMTSALRGAERAIVERPPQNYTQWITAVSRGFLGTGGTSGPLFGMFFRDVAKSSPQGEPSVSDLAFGMTTGVNTIQRYGNAQIGDKTMVDALAPAAEQLTQCSAAPASDALAQAAQAAVQGALSTSHLRARRGRASYVGELGRGVLDPGAVAAAIIVQAAEHAVASAGRHGIDTSWLEA